MPRILIRRQAQIVEAEHHHARGVLRPVERRLAGQRKIRHPFIEPRTEVRPPQELPGVLTVQRRNAALRLQHLARGAVDFPAHIKRQFWLYRHSATSGLKLMIPPTPALLKFSSRMPAPKAVERRVASPGPPTSC